MQCSSALCDVHRALPLLRSTKVTITFTDGRTAQEEEALTCGESKCNRYYSPWRGYFSAQVGEYPDFGVPSKKPQCRHNSEPIYMFLMEKDGVLVWSCPECSATQPCSTKTRIVKPQELTDEEFAAVRALILEGAEVDATHLSDYLRSSHWIALIAREGQLACVGVIKAARPNYIQGIARKSGYALEVENCGGEFGYVVTKAAFRKQGLANALSVALLASFGGPLYATTRDDNSGIHKIVRENGFEHVGEKWRSVEHPGSYLMLWLRKWSNRFPGSS